MQTNYGFEGRLMPDDIDFYNLSNEDIGFVADLVAATNDVYAFAMPYPSSIDLFDETIVVHAIEFLYYDDHKQETAVFQTLAVFLSMLDMEFAATFIGVGADAEDENLKAQFAGPFLFCDNRNPITATAAVEGVERHNDQKVQAMYFPPIPLDLVTPLYVQFVNNSATIALATNAPTRIDFTSWERVSLRVWFTVRKLSPAEKSARNMQIRFQRLDS